MIASAGTLDPEKMRSGEAEDDLTMTGTEWSMVVIFGICVLLLRKTKLNPIWVGTGGCHEGGISAMTNVCNVTGK